jgi:hypothetical protein
MALAALIVAVVSALVSLAAVGVSVWTHKQQGSRLECRCGFAYPVADDDVGAAHVQVKAVNAGRSPTTVSGWGFAFLDDGGQPTDVSVVPPWTLGATPLPARIEAESSVFWLMPLDQLRRTVAEYAPAAKVKAFIDTGIDRRVFADAPVKLSD